MTLTIRRKLILFSVAIVASVCTLLAWLSDRSLTLQTYQSVDNELHQVGEYTSRFISDWLAIRTQMMLVNEDAIASGKEVSELMLQSKRSGDFLSVYAGFDDGTLMVGDKTESWPDNYDARTRPWYQDATRARQLILTAPYQDIDGSLVVSIAKPFNGVRSGVLAADLTVTNIIEVVRETKLNNDGFAFLVDGDNQLLAYREEALTGKPLTILGATLTPDRMNQLAKDQLMYEFQWAENQQTKLLTVIDVPGTNWRLGTVMDKELAFAAVEQQTNLILMLSMGLFVLVALVTAWSIARLLLPLQILKQAIDELSQGDADLSHRLTVIRRDEIGELAQSVNCFIALLQRLISDIATSTGKLDGLVLAAGNNASQTANAVDHQRNQVDQVATAIHELSVSAKEVASHAEMTASAAKASARACEQGQNIIQQNLNAIDAVANQLQTAESVIKELDTNVQGIHRILTNIQGIADQTNLLALNAAIEAARAGAQGRGFAVVADEVRVLSQRTHTATEEVSAMIKTLQQNAQLAVTAMEDSAQESQVSVNCANQASEKLQEITATITQITDMAIQIASAAEQQSAVSEDINQNTQQVREAADDVASQAQNSEHQCHLIQAEAAAINNEINRFRL